MTFLPDDFGIYIHFPLCRRRCGYCEFATVQRDGFPQRDYTDAVLREFHGRRETVVQGRLRSVYLGGGTPSLWDVNELSRVFDGIRGACRVSESLEVTIEVNPGDVSLEYLRTLRRIGVNRISLGAQSLDDRALKTLTRRHGADEVRRSVAWMRDAGFQNVSCDLIAGIPHQQIEHHLEQVRAFCELKPEHLSMYSLTLSKGSAMYRDGLRPVTDDTAADMLERGAEMLDEAGYLHYEVSNYARDGFASIHNSLVWQGRSYLGLGASAVSTVNCVNRESSSEKTNSSTVFAVRTTNPPFDRYLHASLTGSESSAHLPYVEEAKVELITREVAAIERMFLGLRMAQGVDRDDFRRAFGHDPCTRYHAELIALESLGLVMTTQERVMPTAKGVWFADEIALRFLS